MSKIRIPTPLRAYVDGESLITIEGETVGAALADLTARYPQLRPHLYDGEQLRSFVNIYVNQEDIRYLEKEATAVAADDLLIIVPSIAGGGY